MIAAFTLAALSVATPLQPAASPKPADVKDEITQHVVAVHFLRMMSQMQSIQETVQGKDYSADPPTATGGAAGLDPPLTQPDLPSTSEAGGSAHVGSGAGSYTTSEPEWVTSYLCRLAKRAVGVCKEGADPPHWQGTKADWAEACKAMNLKALEKDAKKQCKKFD